MHRKHNNTRTVTHSGVTIANGRVADICMNCIHNFLFTLENHRCHISSGQMWCVCLLKRDIRSARDATSKYSVVIYVKLLKPKAYCGTRGYPKTYRMSLHTHTHTHAFYVSSYSSYMLRIPLNTRCSRVCGFAIILYCIKP